MAEVNLDARRVGWMFWMQWVAASLGRVGRCRCCSARQSDNPAVGIGVGFAGVAAITGTALVRMLRGDSAVKQIAPPNTALEPSAPT